MFQIKTTSLVNVGCLTLFRRDDASSFFDKVLVLNYGLEFPPKHSARMLHFHCVAIIRPFCLRSGRFCHDLRGYEHNEQTIDTNGWNYCLLQSACAHLSHKVSSSELFQRFRRGALASFLCKGSFRGLPCILIGFLWSNAPLNCERFPVLTVHHVQKAPVSNVKTTKACFADTEKKKPACAYSNMFVQ